MNGLALAKKELKQNALLYLLPYLCGLVLIILDWRHLAFLSEEWQNILALILPVAIAGAYGLQSFDLEENGQTRDFLLTKPFTAQQIIKIKYFTGLAVLLPIAFLWILLLLPDSLMIPTLSDWSSFWWVTLFLLVITVYTQSFTAAIFIRGPLKIMAAIGTSFLMGFWFFYSWSEGITILYWFEPFHHPIGSLIILCGFSVALVLFQITMAQNTAYWNLAQLPNSYFRKKLLIYLIILPLIPVLLTGITACCQPAIKPFDQLFTSLFTSRPWFITLEGAKQPGGHLYAYINTTGKLALGKLNQMPQIVYNGSKASSQPLTNLTWSPNGQKILFREGTYLKLFELSSGKTQSLIEGNFGLWSADSTHLLAVEILKSEPQYSEWGQYNQTQYLLSLVDLDDNSVEATVELNSSGSSLAWDSVSNRLLTVDIAGTLVAINLNNNTVSAVPIYETQMKEQIIYSKFEHAGSGKNQFYLTVFSMGIQKPDAVQEKKYSIRSYLLNPDTNTIKPLFHLSGVRYRDIIHTHRPDQLLIRRNNLGIYEKITVPQEASAK